MIDQSQAVRSFVIERLKDVARERGTALPELSDSTDLLGTGLIDSMGFVDLIAAVEEHFRREVDFGAMDVDDFTTLGGFVAAFTADAMVINRMR